MIGPMPYAPNSSFWTPGHTDPLFWPFGGPNRETCCTRTRPGLAGYGVIMGPFNNSHGWHNTSTQHVFEEIFLLLTGDERADLSQLLGKMSFIHQLVETEVKPRRIAVGIKGWTDRLNYKVFKVCQGKEDYFFLAVETWKNMPYHASLFNMNVFLVGVSCLVVSSSYVKKLHQGYFL